MELVSIRDSYYLQLCTHIGSKEKSFSLLEPEAGALGGGACTVIGRTHSVFSLASIKRG